MLDTFLMSCRVMGRKVETALLKGVINRARRAGATSLFGAFIPTAKNSPAKSFLPDHGFQPDSDPQRWRLDLAKGDVTVGDVYRVIDNS